MRIGVETYSRIICCGSLSFRNPTKPQVTIRRPIHGTRFERPAEDLNHWQFCISSLVSE